MFVPVLPPSAPFSAEQRAYLNGFFAGLFGLDTGGSHANGAVPLSLNGSALNGAAPAAPEPEAAEDTPWHDPNLSLGERMELAEGKPQPLKLMAAMAQLDCGQCGYLCKTYSAA